MADITNNSLMHNGRGKLGNRVLKVINGKTFLCKVPDMSGMIPSPAQLQQRAAFKGKYVPPSATATLAKGSIPSQYHHPLAGMKKAAIRQAKILEILMINDVVTNGMCCRKNKVSKTTTFRDLQSLLKMGKIAPSGGKGPAAKYVLVTAKKKRTER